jgi:hypothetical protein
MKTLFIIPSTVCGKNVKVVCAWHPNSVYLAVAGGNGGLHIYRRDGTNIRVVSLNGYILNLNYRSFFFKTNNSVGMG